MRKSVLATCVLCFFLTACHNNEESGDPILSQPPYDKITDSIAQSPNNPELYYHRGGLLFSNNQVNYAERDLRQAWAMQPKEAYALSLTTVLKEKSTDSAINFLQEALKKLPGSIAVKIGLARGYQQKGNFSQALDICRAINATYPQQLDALVLTSDILKTENREAEAIATLERAYSFAPFDKDLSYDLAFEYAESKNVKAVALSDSLIRKDSTETSARAYYVKADYYKNTGNSAEALKNYDAAIRKDYNFMDAYLDKGALLYNQKKYNEALKTFNLALRVSPTTAEFYWWSGKTKEALGNKAEAKLDYERAYGLDKEMKEAKEAGERLK
jgi:tetratricopeptide (TPR) repeat protein